MTYREVWETTQLRPSNHVTGLHEITSYLGGDKQPLET